jgi:dynein heavy chain
LEQGRLFLSNLHKRSRDLAQLQECLCEPQPMELIVPMPIILFKPMDNKKRAQKGVYSCPLYLYPIRTGTRERPSFMINVDLKSGSADPDHWIMRGTALLLSLAI